MKAKDKTHAPGRIDGFPDAVWDEDDFDRLCRSVGKEPDDDDDE